MVNGFSKIENAYILIAHDDLEYLKEIQTKIMEREGIVAIFLENSPAVHSFAPGYLSMYSYTLPYLNPLYSYAILIKCTNASTVIADLMEQISDVVSKLRKEGIVCVVPDTCLTRLNEEDAKRLHPLLSLENLIFPESILLDSKFKDKWTMFEEIGKIAFQAGWIEDEKQFLEDIMKREKIQSTGIGNSIAIPHTMSKSVVKPFLFVILCKSLEYDSIDNQPVKIVLLLGLPKNSHSYLATMSELTKIFINTENIDFLLQCKEKNEIIEFFKEED